MEASDRSPKRPKLDLAPTDVALCSGCQGFLTPDACSLGNSCLRHHADSVENGGVKENFSSGMSKSKPCLKFFSTSGCPYGDGCHFSHYLPGGFPALAMTGSGALGAGKLSGGTGLTSLVAMEMGANLGEYKSRLCNRFGTREVCRFGSKCHFAHGEEELHKSASEIDGFSSFRDSSASGRHAQSALGAEANAWRGRDRAGGSAVGLPTREPIAPGMVAAAAFGASSKTIISIDASLAGAIIGKSGMNAKQISRLTGAKLSIREHEYDLNLRNVEMEGSFEQIKLASQMVRELLMRKDSLPSKPSWFSSHNYKTKMCEKFPRGNCTFGDTCHFAHVDAEMREPAVQA